MILLCPYRTTALSKKYVDLTMLISINAYKQVRGTYLTKSYMTCAT